MSLVDTLETVTQTRFLLAFGRPSGSPPTYLELRHAHAQPPRSSPYRYSEDDGYWKIGVTLPDVDVACRRLRATGTRVSEPHQFQDIGYLCHLCDPEGYRIELLQHRFAHTHEPAVPDDRYALGSEPTLGQITLRIKDPAKSLPFYQEGLGMRLLSRQRMDSHGFTLYFLAFTHESPPLTNVDAVENREWLWQRPYTTLELQHRWGTEHADFEYIKHRKGTTGFWGLGFVTKCLDELVARGELTLREPARASGNQDTRAMIATDPDGYTLRFTQAAAE